MINMPIITIQLCHFEVVILKCFPLLSLTSMSIEVFWYGHWSFSIRVCCPSSTSKCTVSSTPILPTFALLIYTSILFFWLCDSYGRSIVILGIHYYELRNYQILFAGASLSTRAYHRQMSLSLRDTRITNPRELAFLTQRRKRKKETRKIFKISTPFQN